jgi:hypothetical protein
MLAAILVAGLTLFLGLTQTGIDDATQVVGRVTSGPQSRPSSNASVVAASGSQIAWTRADRDGRYAFLTLLPGVYSLTAYEGNDTGLCQSGEQTLVELSAGVQYLANLSIEEPCSN